MSKNAARQGKLFEKGGRNVYLPFLQKDVYEHLCQTGARKEMRPKGVRKMGLCTSCGGRVEPGFKRFKCRRCWKIYITEYRAKNAERLKIGRTEHIVGAKERRIEMALEANCPDVNAVFCKAGNLVHRCGEQLDFHIAFKGGARRYYCRVCLESVWTTPEMLGRLKEWRGRRIEITKEEPSVWQRIFGGKT